MILGDLRFRKLLPVRILTDAHRSSTSEAVAEMMKERGARMQFVLSGATQNTQFMDIRGGAAQALKNGGNLSTESVITRYYDKNQECKYRRRYSPNGNILPMKIQNVIKITEESLKNNVTKTVIQRSWDKVGIDLLPDLRKLSLLSLSLKRAFVHTPSTADNLEEIAAAWEENQKVKQEERDARKISWECPHCSAIVENSTFKITNGKDKGITLKEKHIKNCSPVPNDELEDSNEEVSSTEERVRKGKQLKELKKQNRVKKCPYLGCNKIYRGSSMQYFTRHVKECSYKNQKELGKWVIRNSKTYDYNLLE